MKHIRNERATNERLKLLDVTFPSDHGVAWCEADCSNEPVFQHVEQALHALETGITPCINCLRAIRGVIDAALKEQKQRCVDSLVEACRAEQIHGVHGVPRLHR